MIFWVPCPRCCMRGHVESARHAHAYSSVGMAPINSTAIDQGAHPMRIFILFLAAAMVAIVAIRVSAQPTATATTRPEKGKSPASQPTVTIDLSTPRPTLDTLHRAAPTAD